MRAGTFSSSSAWKLMTKDKSGKGFGAPALKYIKQVNHEIKLGRAITTEQSSRPTTWGLAVQRYVFDMLHLSYVWMDGSRFFHPDVPRWSGSPDTLKETTVGDVKCPMLENFCDKIAVLERALRTGDLTEYKTEYPEDYWQHISNSILLQKNGYPCDHFEAIIFCPYKSELEAIREMILQMDNNEAFKWIYYAHDNELPWLYDGGHYKNLNVFRFPIPAADKIALHERVVEAGKLLIEVPKMIAA